MAERVSEESQAVSASGIPRPQQVFDPVARALDLIGERWKLVLIGHLLRGPKGF